MKLRVAATAVGAAAAMALVAGSPAHAQAAHRYDHKDPYRSGCGNSARVVETADIKSRIHGEVGTIKLMWSGKCKTNWVEIRTAKSATGTIRLYTGKGRTTKVAKIDTFSFKKGNGGRHWGNMLYANNVCAWGSVSVQWNGGRGGQNGSGMTDPEGACD
ncbi:DUF2690 domain-containing protein [Nonomuraea sp. SYSU D8015]|uniref:DUF2690 domain-containing protein n=1 Tax=Nonomuraea sp. SYSU D8015 TaxID=2593644 RepID=UPI001660E080|nr:DUF2690 domain-containing protein [Nonomuraea sp. SYSU D8015]